MADDRLFVIPSDPEYVPSPGAQHMAFALFSSFVRTADEVALRETETIEFVDPGENFQSVKCSACGVELGEWWREAAEAAFASQFTELVVEMPCCGAKLSLNDLNYSWPAGFARFRLEARNPIADIDDNQLAMLASVLKCDVRKVVARY